MLLRCHLFPLIFDDVLEDASVLVVTLGVWESPVTSDILDIKFSSLIFLGDNCDSFRSADIISQKIGKMFCNDHHNF